MKKIKIERSLKLRKEDLRSKKTNVITNNQEIEENWLGSFGDQKEIYYDKVMPIIENIHKEKAHIANAVTEQDRENEKLRLIIQYKPKTQITHESSIRYRHIPKDNGIF